MQLPREQEFINKCPAESDEGGPKSETQQAAISVAELLFQSKSQEEVWRNSRNGETTHQRLN